MFQVVDQRLHKHSHGLPQPSKRPLVSPSAILLVWTLRLLMMVSCRHWRSPPTLPPLFRNQFLAVIKSGFGDTPLLRNLYCARVPYLQKVVGLNGLPEPLLWIWWASTHSPPGHESSDSAVQVDIKDKRYLWWVSSHFFTIVAVTELPLSSHRHNQLSTSMITMIDIWYQC